MTNPFILDYQERLKAWRKLRLSCNPAEIENSCVQIDRFWQQSPMVNHYLHPDDVETWPDPWQLLNDNLYCDYARALGIIYTLFIVGIEDVDFVEATDYHNNDVLLVLVDCAKYVMNYWPDQVLNSSQSDFTIKRYINIDSIRESVHNFIDK